MDIILGGVKVLHPITERKELGCFDKLVEIELECDDRRDYND